jgi:SAM-dependent methyltransferase
MHPEIKAKIMDICAGREFESVLEIGATEESTLLLKSPFADVRRRVGIDLNSWDHPELEIHGASAHEMDMFDSGTFDCVVCNAVLEHDPAFWRTLAEIRRVAATGALLVVGVPGYSGRVERAPVLDMLGVSSAAADLEGPDVASRDDPAATDNGHDAADDESRRPLHRLYDTFPRSLQQKTADTYRSIKSRDGPVAKTYGIHESPGDYYRFSPQAVEEVFLRDCLDSSVYDILRPPRLIGAGKYEGG